MKLPRSGGPRGLVLSLTLLALLLALPAAAAEEATPSPAAGADDNALHYMGVEDEFHRYEFPDGSGFYSTVKDGETDALLAAFAFDEGVGRAFTLDGTRLDYENESVLAEAGLYRIVLLNSNTLESAVYTFTVSPLALDKAQGSLDFEGLFEELLGGAPQADVKLRTRYDAASGRYAFAFPDGAEFYATAPNGAVGDKCVLTFEAGITASRWADGATVSYESGTVLDAQGAYHFILYHRGTDADGATVSYSAAFYALVLSGPANCVDALSAPIDFTLESVTLDGEALPLEYPKTARLRRDGIYTLRYLSDFSPRVRYTVSVTRDTQAPILYFSEGALSGSVEDWVYYEKAEAESELEIKLNHQPYPASGWLAENGSYQLRVSDRAGNVRSYYITVAVPLRLGFRPYTWILIGAVCAAIGVWMLVVRCKSRTI